ncbi:MAG: capsule biosynthesis protein [Sphingomonas sp.]|nr:capsule biosynthesis protein [Sphingomonas sp.]
MRVLRNGSMVMKFSNKQLRRRGVIGLAALMAWANPAFAQVQLPLPGQQTNIPQGSPLDPGATVGQQSVPPATILGQDDQPFRPTTIDEPDANAAQSTDQLSRAQTTTLDRNARIRQRARPSEFEDYVAKIIGRPLPRFGQDLILPSQRDFSSPSTSTVPPDYRLNIGDTVVISLTGSVSGSVDRQIDTNGNIFLPNVGVIRLAGVRYADARDKISTAIGTQYRNYSVNLTVKALRGIRVYVTGFANNPGAFTVNSLSTVANAVLQAGGPAAGGSFRSVKLYRNGAEVVDFDLYELIRGGNRVNDAVLQNEDVLFIPPAGEQIAVIGSVNQEAIYEAKPGETVNQLLAIAGGSNVLGETDRVLLYRTKEKPELGAVEIAISQATSMAARGGDILQILSKGSLAQSVQRKFMLVRIEGEVNNPGNFFVPPNTSLNALLEIAGGLTPRAFPFATRLVRQSVRVQQRESYQQALDQLEQTIVSAPLVSSTRQSESSRAAELASSRELLRRLRTIEPDGRVVLDIPVEATSLPGDLAIENNDSITVPIQPSTIGVFGAVFRPASFLLTNKGLTVREYIERAGGMQRVADSRSIFVVRANGDVLSRKRGALKATVLPGDVIFVPVRAKTASAWQQFLEVASTVFQFGLTAAVVASVVE